MSKGSICDLCGGAVKGDGIPRTWIRLTHSGGQNSDCCSWECVRAYAESHILLDNIEGD